MTSETPLVSSVDMSQPDVTTAAAGSTERLSPEKRASTERLQEGGENVVTEPADEEDGPSGREDGCSPTPAEDTTPSSAEEGKPEGGKKKNRLRQGLINIKRKLFSRKKGGKLKDGGKGSRKTKSASNVLEVVEDDPAKMGERAMSADSVYPADMHRGMTDARSLETMNMAALQSRLKGRKRGNDDDSLGTSATDVTQPYGGSTQSLGSMTSLENEGMEDFFRTNWSAGDNKRTVSPEPRIKDLDMVPGAKLLGNKAAKQKINVKPKKTRPASRPPRTRTASPHQKSASSLAQVKEETQSEDPQSPKKQTAKVTDRDTSLDGPRSELGVKSPVREASRRETGKAKEESTESKKEPAEVKLKHRDELRVTQVRRAPSERIGMAVKLRDNSGTPESKVKRRMVSSDCSPSESQSARLQQEPIAWLSCGQKKDNVKSKDTGSKSLLEAKTKKENVVQVRNVSSERKAQEKSDGPEETTEKRSSSEGASVDEVPSTLSTQNDDTATADDTEFSQMFNKLRQKSYKKVKAPGDEKENAVSKTTAKEAGVATSSQKPPLVDADSNAGTPTVDNPVDVVAGKKTVLVIEKTVPKSSSKLESPSEGSLPKRSSPLLKDRARRQTLPVSPSQARALSPEKEEDSKVKRSVSQRKPTEPSPLASSPPSSSTSGSIIRASTAAQMEPKKLFGNDDTSGTAPPWAAMALKKTSKFEQNKKLNKGVDATAETVSAGADSKPEPVTTDPAVVDTSNSKTGHTNTESTSSAATKPVVLIIAAKPSTTSVASTGVSSTTTKPVVSNVASKTTVCSTTTKVPDSSVTSKSSTTAPAASVPKTTGSSTVFASNVKSNTPAVSKAATNVVVTRKKSDEKKAGETILASDQMRRDNFSGKRQSRVLDMVKNWQNPQVADA